MACLLLDLMAWLIVIGLAAGALRFAWSVFKIIVELTGDWVETKALAVFAGGRLLLARLARFGTSE